MRQRHLLWAVAGRGRKGLAIDAGHSVLAGADLLVGAAPRAADALLGARGDAALAQHKPKARKGWAAGSANTAVCGGSGGAAAIGWRRRGGTRSWRWSAAGLER